MKKNRMFCSESQRQPESGETGDTCDEECNIDQSVELPDYEAIAGYYATMTDRVFLAHIKSILEELPNRTNLQIDETSSDPVKKSEQVPSDHPCSSGLKEPKDELPDEEYLVMHENATGFQYNYRDDSYTWNPPPVGDVSIDMTIAKQLNELNNYGLQKSEPEKKAVTPKPSAKRSDPQVDCKCSICREPFNTVRKLLDHRLLTHSPKDMLTCGICGKVCLKRTHIFLHLSQEYKVFHCDKCQVSFSSTYHLNKHKCKLTYDRKRKRANRKRTLTEAMIKSECGEQHEEDCEAKGTDSGGSSMEKTLTCETCNKTYNSAFWFEKHKETCDLSKTETKPLEATHSEPPMLVREPSPKEKKTSKFFACPHCKASFFSQLWLTHHISRCIVRQLPAEVPGGPSTSSACFKVEMPVLVDNSFPTCPDESEDAFKIELEMIKSDGSHQQIDIGKHHTEPQIPPTKCSICKLCFNNISSLLLHRKSSHGTSAMLTCSTCGKQCNSVSTIRRHMSQEFGLFPCEMCGRKCVDRCSLQRHNCDPKFRVRSSPAASSHSIKCPKCGDLFPNATLLYSHRMKCGPLTICPQNESEDDTRPTSSNARQARAAARGMRGPTVKNEQFSPPILANRPPISTTTRLECLQCSETFSLRSDLSRHRMEAHGKEAFQCSFCPKTFTNYRALNDHHMIETQKYKCATCGKVFGRKYMLEFHEGFCGRK